MRRIRIMTVGFVLAFIGLQLNVIDSYELNPRFSTLVAEHSQPADQFQPIQPTRPSPYYQASWAPVQNPGATSILTTTKVVRPPRWICWPILFCGTVLVLHGFIRND